MTGYLPDLIAETSQEELLDGERTLRDACAAHGVGAVVGTPYLDEASASRFNSATLIDSSGGVVGRRAGRRLSEAGFR